MMELRPKTFCTKCYESVEYRIKSRMKEISVREVSFIFPETVAVCKECGTEVYVPAINDKNCYEREKAYYNKLGELNHAD